MGITVGSADRVIAGYGDVLAHGILPGRGRANRPPAPRVPAAAPRAASRRPSCHTRRTAVQVVGHRAQRRPLPGDDLPQTGSIEAMARKPEPVEETRAGRPASFAEPSAH